MTSCFPQLLLFKYPTDSFLHFTLFTISCQVVDGDWKKGK